MSQQKTGDHPLHVHVELKKGRFCARCNLAPGALTGELEYAFYLLINGKKAEVRWYNASPFHIFSLRPEVAEGDVQVRGFVRVAALPEERLAATSAPLKVKSAARRKPVVDKGAPASNRSKENKVTSPEGEILRATRKNARILKRNIITSQNRLYAQLESLSWLQRRLRIKGQLPPLRGWAASPDVLLHLHTHIRASRPETVVEIGSGASTLVIADALRQNGLGRLISLEHSEYYGAHTVAHMEEEQLIPWVDLRIGCLEQWEGPHMSYEDAEQPAYWYPRELLQDIGGVDLLWVDGPPGATCLYSRYPALPALTDHLSEHAEVWMDDTARKEEKDICNRWARDYGFNVDYLPLEKGLGRLTRAKGYAANEPDRSLSRVTPSLKGG